MEEKKTDLIAVMAETQLMERAAFWNIVRKTEATPNDFTDEEVMVFLAVAQQMGLSPLNGEIYAFKGRGGKIMPLVGIDGWLRKANDHPMFDGMEVVFDEKEQSATCTIWRKDRSHPSSATEYLVECKKNTGPWNDLPRRMLRHRAIIQCVRIAFGSGGAYDEDDRHYHEIAHVDLSASTQATVERLSDSLVEARGADQVWDEDYAPAKDDPPADDDGFVPCSVAGCGNEADGVCKECATPLCDEHQQNGFCAICAQEV